MMQRITDRAENIFRTISRSDPCNDLNKTLLPNFYPHNCFYQMSDNKYLVKYFNDHELYRWELYVYNKLQEHNIVPTFINYGKSAYTNMSAIALDTTRMYSLRNVLYSKRIDKHLVINELFSFINKLKEIGIIHNNLTIDSIYIKDNSIQPQFYIIEFTNMKIKKDNEKNLSDLNILNTCEEKHDDNIDIFSLYSSIVSLEKNNDIIEYIKNTILNKYNIDSYNFIHTITDYYN